MFLTKVKTSREQDKNNWREKEGREMEGWFDKKSKSKPTKWKNAEWTHPPTHKKEELGDVLLNPLLQFLDVWWKQICLIFGSHFDTMVVLAEMVTLT